jgi:hypothetical protein
VCAVHWKLFAIIIIIIIIIRVSPCSQYYNKVTRKSKVVWNSKVQVLVTLYISLEMKFHIHILIIKYDFFLSFKYLVIRQFTSSRVFFFSVLCSICCSDIIYYYTFSLHNNNDDVEVIWHYVLVCIFPT